MILTLKKLPGKKKREKIYLSFCDTQQNVTRAKRQKINHFEYKGKGRIVCTIRMREVFMKDMEFESDFGK